MTAPLSSWVDRAECRDHPSPEVFDTDEHGSPDWIRAMNLCGVCPVQSQCLDAALLHLFVDDVGIWGGTTRSERVDVRRDRGMVSHGTTTAYRKHRCRCQDCRDAVVASKRRAEARKVERAHEGRAA